MEEGAPEGPFEGGPVPSAEMLSCPECGRELPVRMMAVHRNRVHNVPLPEAAPPDPEAPDPTVPPWISAGPGPSSAPEGLPAEEEGLPVPGPETSPELPSEGTDEEGLAEALAADEAEGRETELPPHEHELPLHDHPFPSHDHELPAHEHEPYRDQLENQEADLSQLKVSLANLRQSVEDKEEEIRALHERATMAEEERARLAEELTRVRDEQSRTPAGVPVVVYRSEEGVIDAVHWMPLEAPGGAHGLLERLIEFWHQEGLSLEFSGLPPNLSVRVRGDRELRGFEMVPSSVLFVRLSARERARLLPPTTPEAEGSEPAASPGVEPASEHPRPPSEAFDLPPDSTGAPE